MERGLVSIITPMYNAQKYIEKTIQSVQEQTFLNWEMIVMDDCSTDESAKIVKCMAEKDSRIRYFCNEINVGVAETRNHAMEAANGQYFAFLDSDDLWVPDKLERQLALLEEKCCAFTYAGCDVIDENGNAIQKVRHVPEYITYKKLLWGNVIPCLTVLIDREKTPPFQMPKIGHEDYATWLTVFKDIGEGYGIDEVLGHYRVNRNSVSGNKLRTIKWTWNIYRNNQGINPVKSVCYLFGHLFQAAKKMR